jgi:peptidoglycan lytic transglycosylase
MTSTGTATPTGRSGAQRPGARRDPARRGGEPPRSGPGRGILIALLVVVILGAGFLLLRGPISDALREVTLPLRHEDIIRQQARDKGLDPALIAAIIYEESRFRPQTSHAGAEGLMQIVPGTAHFIAERSGGTQFELRDLDTPQINIQYGSWYLRYLVQQYGDVDIAVAAYNAGETNVNRWITAAGGLEQFEVDQDVPFPETRQYVSNVRERRDEYARHYAKHLGL